VTLIGNTLALGVTNMSGFWDCSIPRSKDGSDALEPTWDDEYKIRIHHNTKGMIYSQSERKWY
jgi:hypothetical protein